MARKTKIAFNPFDIESIDDAIQKLDVYGKRLDAKMDIFLQRLAEAGVTIAKSKVLMMDAVFTTELLNSIHLEQRGTAYFIVSDSKHTAFVEFGTGDFGEMNPPPYLPRKVHWDYNVGEHVKYADEDLQWGDWLIPAGSYYWWYVGKDGRWHLSRGMRSRPFMYETLMQLSRRNVIAKVAKEVFNEP